MRKIKVAIVPLPLSAYVGNYVLSYLESYPRSLWEKIIINKSIIKLFFRPKTRIKFKLSIAVY